MKKLLLSLLTACAFLNMSATIAAEDFDRQIKARQAVMQLYAYNLGLLGAMAKGQAEYDAGQASAAAANLDALVTMNNSTMWPMGSHMKANPGKTWAKEENWTNYPEAAEKFKALKTASATMAAEAGNGLDAVRGAIGAIGASCQGCHKAFRGSKN